MSARRALALALLLGGCVINTRPHLPAEDGADASLTNGATRDPCPLYTSYAPDE